jgi:hypothetical protein
MHRNNADLGGKTAFSAPFHMKNGFFHMKNGFFGAFSREKRAKINEIQQKNANFSHKKFC